MDTELSRAEVQATELPNKLLKDDQFMNASSVSVNFNAFKLSLKEDLCIHKHELVFKITISKNGNEKELNAAVGPKNDVASRSRRRLLWELYTELINQNPTCFGDNPKKMVYDCGINFYSLKTTLKKGERKEFKINLEDENISRESYAYMGRNVARITAAVLYTGSFVIKRNMEFSQRDHSELQFFDVLANQQIFQNDEFLLFANGMFKRTEEVPLQGVPMVLKSGLQKNVRLVGDGFEQALAVMQIDSKKSAFFPEVMVEEFVRRLLNVNESRRLCQELENNIDTVASQLRGVTVITTHLAANRLFVISGISKKNCYTMKFQTTDGGEINVNDYFFKEHNMRLREPKLLCVIEKNKGRADSFHPMEVLKIVGGQRVPLEKQTPKFTEQMIGKCQALPIDFAGNVKKQRENAMLTNSNPFFKAHGVSIDSNMLDVNADLLFPPGIVFADTNYEPSPNGELKYGSSGRRFIRPASISKWVAMIIHFGVPASQCENFIDQLVRVAQQLGMDFNKPVRYESVDDTSDEAMNKLIENYYKHGVRFVMFFTRDKLDSFHHNMKIMEVNHKIVTQHISSQTVQRSNHTTIMNILLKTNLKLGGINYSLKTASQFLRKNAINGEPLAQQWLHSSRMFIGIDISHAGAQNLFERNTGAKVNPSVLGMAYTVGHPCRMFGTFFVQPARVARALYLTERVVIALSNFKLVNNTLPKQVFVYRGGVSEGEYRILATYEKQAFEDAFKQVYKDIPLPELVIIVVQRNSNYRIVPSNIRPGRAMEQNVQPGTVIDERAMSPAYTEFLLVAHKTIQGTARPVRCTVIVDTCSPRIPLTELERVTYALCYTHAIVNSPVSVPGPLYSAGDLAKRGSNNLKTANLNIYTQEVDEKAIEHFYLDLSRKIDPNMLTRYWA